jgi:hypothetical protein
MGYIFYSSGLSSYPPKRDMALNMTNKMKRKINDTTRYKAKFTKSLICSKIANI